MRELQWSARLREHMQAGMCGTIRENSRRITGRDWRDGRDELGIPSVHVARFSPLSRFRRYCLWRWL